jgi:hypothetical protein
MIVERRTFQTKVGQAGAVVGKLKEAEELMIGIGFPSGRILTDYMSGSTDRVVWEIEVESLGSLESMMDNIGSDAAKFGAWFEQLTALLESASVEHWKIEN